MTACERHRGSTHAESQRCHDARQTQKSRLESLGRMLKVFINERRCKQNTGSDVNRQLAKIALSQAETSMDHSATNNKAHLCAPIMK